MQPLKTSQNVEVYLMIANPKKRAKPVVRRRIYVAIYKCNTAIDKKMYYGISQGESDLKENRLNEDRISQHNAVEALSSFQFVSPAHP